MKPPCLLVVGGTGYFGRLLVDDLLQHATGRLVLAGRNLCALESLRARLPDRVDLRQLDLHDSTGIEVALEKIAVVVNAAGPFQAMPITLARACISRGIHYIDLADDRQHVLNVRSLATRGMNAALCSGWSAVPALSAALTRIAAADVGTVQEIQVQIAPGNRAPRGTGTVASLLHSVGATFSVWRDGEWKVIHGWSEPRTFNFPEPVGPRIGFFVNVPDLELFPSMFGARRVEFRVGPELRTLNAAVSALAWLRRRGLVRDWAQWTNCLRTGMSLLGWLGSDAGAVGVEVKGEGRARRACVVAEREGQRIPVMPAAVMAARLADAQDDVRGLVPLDSWIDRRQLEIECTRRGFRLLVEDVP